MFISWQIFSINFQVSRGWSKKKNKLLVEKKTAIRAFLADFIENSDQQLGVASWFLQILEFILFLMKVVILIYFHLIENLFF